MEVVIAITWWGRWEEKSDNMYEAVKSLAPPLISFMAEFIQGTLPE